MRQDKWQELCSLLSSLPTGDVQDVSGIKFLLADCWRDISGSGEQHTTADKLRSRLMEDVHWEPPELSFTIERHGGTVAGSTRAALHRWSINVATKAACCNPHYSYRQVVERARPIRVKPIADRLAGLIISGQEDPCLKWLKGRDSVRVNLHNLVTDGSDYKQTITGRVQRLRYELIGLLDGTGWKWRYGSRTVFERKSNPRLKRVHRNRRAAGRLTERVARTRS